jgi:hypothetical protein
MMMGRAMAWLGTQATRLRNAAGSGVNAFRHGRPPMNNPAQHFLNASGTPLRNPVSRFLNNTSGAVRAMFAPDAHAARRIGREVGRHNGVNGRTNALSQAARDFTHSLADIERATIVNGRRAWLGNLALGVGGAAAIVVGVTKGVPAWQEASRRTSLENEQKALVQTTGLKTVPTKDGDRVSVAPDSLQQAIQTMVQTNQDLAADNQVRRDENRTLEDRLKSSSKP